MSENLTPQQKIVDLTDKLQYYMDELTACKGAYLAVSKRARKAKQALGMIAIGRGVVRVPEPIRFEPIMAKSNIGAMDMRIMEIESWKFADSVMYELLEMKRQEPFPPPAIPLYESKAGQS